MKKILVIDGRSIASLAIARSLGEKGFEIHCGDDFNHNITAYSRFVKKRFKYSSPDEKPADFISDILRIIKKEKYELLICAQDDTILLLSKHQKEILKYTNLYLPEYEIIKKFVDKGTTIKLAHKAGVPTPKTYFPEDTGIENIKNIVEYPVLVRARISSGSRGIKLVNSSEEFDFAYDEIKNNFGEPIIQEYIIKKGYTADCLLLDSHQIEYASFSYEKLKEYPVGNGPMVVGKSTDNQLTKLTKKYSSNLLKQLKFKGIAEVEYILNENNEPLLLEVNPRIWMHLKHAIDSGVDFPFLLYNLATHNTVKPLNSYKSGVKYRWVFPFEILWLLNAPNKLKGLKEFINFWEKDLSLGVFSFKDPFPVIGVISQSLYFLSDSKRRKIVLGRDL